MFYIDTGTWEQTFSAWTSTAESICPIQKYELYSQATNTSSYKLSSSDYNMPNTNTTTVSFANTFTNTLRSSIEFYVRAEWLGTGIHAGGGKYQFSEKMTYQVVCGSELLSIRTVVGNSTHMKYNYTHTTGHNGGGNLASTLTQAQFAYDILTNQSQCGVTEFELRETNNTVPSNVFLASETRISYNYGTKQITLSNGENWYNEVGIRAWTTARNNTQGSIGGVVT